ncbi:MAG: hypothetical protein RL238_1213 [Actinomycetota bacterium]
MVGLSACLLVVLWGAAFATATTCTNGGGANCDRVDLAAYLGMGAGLIAGLMALFGPWPRRARRITYAVVMVEIGLLAFILMNVWSA